MIIITIYKYKKFKDKIVNYLVITITIIAIKFKLKEDIINKILLLQVIIM